MQAIRVHAFGPPEVMRYEEVGDPSPARDEIIVRARAIGVNPVDTYVRTGIKHEGDQCLPFGRTLFDSLHA